MCRPIVIVFVYTCAICIYQTIESNAQSAEAKEAARANDECQVTPVIHVLQYPGCVPKPIPSFACIGRCSSYLQVGVICCVCSFFFVYCWQHRFAMRQSN